MIPSPEELNKILENIWTSTLGVGLVAVAEEKPQAGPALTGCVHITGPWAGALVLELPAPGARLAAAAMFGMEPATVGDAEMRDALGELANIAGGNFKKLLPVGCQLSLPTVIEGNSYTVVVANGRLVRRQTFESQGQGVQLSLFERASGAGS